MQAFELLLLFAGLVAHVSAQWVRYTSYFPNSPPPFLVGAPPEQIEQFKRIIANDALSAKEYNEQMEALVAQMSPAAQEAYMRRIEEVKEYWKLLGRMLIELTSDLDEEVRTVAKQVFNVMMATGEYTPQEVDRKKLAIYGTLSSKTHLEQFAEALGRSGRFIKSLDLPLLASAERHMSRIHS